MTHDDTHDDDTDDEQESPTRADVLKAALGLESDTPGRAAKQVGTGPVTTDTAHLPFDRFGEIVIDHDGDTYRVVETPDGLALEREGEE